MDVTGISVIDPPVILSSASVKAVIVKWQTSIPGLAASPVEEHRLAPETKHEFLRHANFWISKDGTVGNGRSVLNQIEVWIFDGENTNILLSNFKTFRPLFPANLAQDDKTVILEIDISANLGIDVRLNQFR
ncbi:MAG: hypothetical protein HN420_06535 [Rhodospirillaceae bacterium]|nr:hypothetical protein [Rhodospirillaceae bacterium]